MRPKTVDTLEALGREQLLAVLGVSNDLCPRVNTRALAYLAKRNVHVVFGPKPPDDPTILGAFFSLTRKIALYQTPLPERWVLAHEIGHALDYVLSENWNPFSRVSHTHRVAWLNRHLNGVDLNQRAHDPAEWFAEAYRLWIGEHDGGRPQSRADVMRGAPELAELFQAKGL